MEEHEYKKKNAKQRARLILIVLLFVALVWIVPRYMHSDGETEAPAAQTEQSAGGLALLTDPPQSEAPAETPQTQPATDADAVPFDALDFRWGGFNGKSAQLAGCRVSGLRVTPNGLSYKWTVGGCEDLDRSCTHSNPSCTCALFCRVGGKWIGGKFDHISTDRRTRDFENINDGYGGWNPSALRDADAFAFVILDDGARRRTNVIVQEGGAR